MIQNYLPIVLHAAIAVGFAAGALGVSALLGRVGVRNATKDTAYECGMLPIGPAHTRFSVKFYLVAMLFILFDLEIVFMYPWAVVYRDLVGHSLMVLWSMLGFVGILLVAYIYALKKGALDWKS